jgi:predicted nucleic acid-binding protein
MKPLRVYIDTSVVGGCLEAEFRDASVELFDRFRTGRMIMVASDLLESEIRAAPFTVQAILDDPALKPASVLVTVAADHLAERYIAGGVIGRANYHDALHVATATVHQVDVLASWDFKHIINWTRIRGYNAVNAGEGYRPLTINSPQEVIRHGRRETD